MAGEKAPKQREPYFGSVRFFKNMILLAVLVCIAVPTVLAVRGHLRAGELERALEETAAQLSQLEAGEVQSAELQADPLAAADLAEPISYQELYPDFYVAEPMPEQTATPGTMYLTFDDGPSDNTEEILAVLAEKGVKATFFIVTQGGDTAVARMKRIAEEGHTLGMHSWSHDYKKIYTSVEAFLEDYYQLFTLIRDQVGVTPTVFRFPGGSLNGYNSGLYEEIIAEMLRRGFVYYDWNLSAQDAATVPPSKDQILHGILDSSAGKRRGFVLMHDIARCDSTVEALPELIDGLQEQGFTFDKIDRSVLPVTFSYHGPGDGT